MKALITALVFATLMSCTTYQYLHLDGVTANKNNREELVFENDSVWLSYDFSGRWGAMALKVQNKTDQPMFINWQKSVIIKDGQSISLYNPQVDLNGGIYRQPYTRESEVNASFRLPEGTDFMAPGTATSRAGIDISRVALSLNRLADTSNLVKQKNESGSVVKYRQQAYQATSSPIRFQVYLTFGIGSDNKEFALLHEFYVSRVIETENGPEVFSLYKPAADQVYVALP